MSSTRKISRFWDELRIIISFPRFVQEFLKIVNFKMSSELFETHMLKCLINIDKEELEEKRSLLRDKVSLFSVQISTVLVHQALERKDQLEEEKDKILALLFKAQGALLDDEDLIGKDEIVLILSVCAPRQHHRCQSLRRGRHQRTEACRRGQ